MPGPAFVMEWAATDSEATLKARYQSERHLRRRQWLQGLWLLRCGWRVDDVAEAVGAGRRTVERWVDWYRTSGIDGVLARRPGGVGQRSRLTNAQQERVAVAVASGRFRTAAEVGTWISATFGVYYRPGGVQDLLGRLRCHPKVPRPLHELADLDVQEAWKKGASPRRLPPQG